MVLIPEIILDYHAKMYNADIPGAKFRIGQLVELVLPQHKQSIPHTPTGHVTSVKKLDDGEFEYTVTGIRILLWEDELRDAGD